MPRVTSSLTQTMQLLVVLKKSF